MDLTYSTKTTITSPITRTASFVIGLVVVVAVGLTGKVVNVSSAPRNGGVKSFTISEHPVHLNVKSNVFNKQWAGIQEALCPTGIPNTAFGPTLFAMARAELGITSEMIQQDLAIDRPTATKALTYLFYNGRFAKAAVYNSGNHTIAYVPIWKAGNNAIRQWMSNLVGGNDALQYSPPERFFDGSKEGLRPTCIVTAIRDPISHFLSGYNEIEYRKDSIANNTVTPYYCFLPFSTEDQRRDRFAQFVRDILLGQSRALLRLPFSHVFSMSRVLEVLSRNGGVLSGYLPSIANLSADLPSIFKKTCQLTEDLPTMKDTRWTHKSSSDPEGFYHSAKTVWAEGGEVARALCILHAMDYACWKDLPDGVPKICEDVYSRPEFIASIVPLAS